MRACFGKEAGRVLKVAQKKGEKRGDMMARGYHALVVIQVRAEDRMFFCLVP